MSSHNPYQSLTSDSPFRLDLTGEITSFADQLGLANQSLGASTGTTPAYHHQMPNIEQYTEEHRYRRLRRYSLAALECLRSDAPDTQHQARHTQNEPRSASVSQGNIDDRGLPSLSSFDTTHPSRHTSYSHRSQQYCPGCPPHSHSQQPAPVLVRRVNSHSSFRHLNPGSAASAHFSGSNIPYLSYNPLRPTGRDASEAEALFAPSLLRVSRSTTPPGNPPQYWQARFGPNRRMPESPINAIIMPRPFIPVRRISPTEMPPPPFIPSRPSQQSLPQQPLPPPPAYAPNHPSLGARWTSAPPLPGLEEAAVRILSGLNISKATPAPSPAFTPPLPVDNKTSASRRSSSTKRAEVEKKAEKVVDKKTKGANKVVDNDDPRVAALEKANFDLRVKIAALEVAQKKSDYKLGEAIKYHEGRLREVTVLNKEFGELQEKYDELEREKNQLQLDIEAIYQEGEVPRVKRGRSSIIVNRASHAEDEKENESDGEGGIIMVESKRKDSLRNSRGKAA